MGQAQINVRTRACSGTFIARTKQVALTHNVRGKELIQSRPHVVYFNGLPTGHCLASVESGAANHDGLIGRTDTATVVGGVRVRECMHVHASVRDVFAIYDNDILPRLIMIIIKIIILYFIQIRHTDDFS